MQPMNNNKVVVILIGEMYAQVQIDNHVHH